MKVNSSRSYLKPGDIYKNLSDTSKPEQGDLRIYWVPQIPCKPFYWRVRSKKEASDMLDMLAAYDDFQFAERIKGDYSNTGSLEIFAHGDWEEWESDDCDDFNTWRKDNL